MLAVRIRRRFIRSQDVLGSFGSSQGRVVVAGGLAELA